MKLNIIPGKLRLKNSNGIKKTKRLIEKNTLLGNNNKPTKIIHKEFKEKEINNFEITGIIEGKEEDKIIKECSKKLEKDDKIDKNKDIDDLMGKLTQAEKLFYEKKMKKLPDKIQKMARTTFKEKYQQYYKALTKLPEHHDIPKVGPG